MFDTGSQPTITELMLKSADPAVIADSTDFSTDFSTDLTKIGVWVGIHAFVELL